LSETEIGWGVLGAAGIARKRVLPAIAASSNSRLVALASRSPEHAGEMLAPYPGAQVSDSYEALLARPDVDAVYIPLPNGLHREWTLRALDAGKHVLCEKPLAVNAGEAEEMATAATASGKHLMEAFMYRFHPTMREFVRGLSDAVHVQSSFGFTVQDAHDIRLQAPLGGGALLDVGCYTVSVARWILGEPVEILARARIKDGVDVSVSGLLAFAEERTASVWASLESAEEQDLTVITRDRVDRRETPFSRYRDPHDPYQLMVESFAESVLHDHPVAIPLSESIANMRVLDGIRDSFTSSAAFSEP
jgi:predicted dehydrogenase